MKYKEIISYLIFGVLTTLVSLLSYYLLSTFVFNINRPFWLMVVNVISWILSILFAFFTNKKYVFKNDEKGLNQFFKFVGGRIYTLVLDVLIMFIFVSILHFNDKIIKIISQIIIIVANYVISKIFVFRREK